jgi:hypothetical protein
MTAADLPLTPVQERVLALLRSSPSGTLGAGRGHRGNTLKALVSKGYAEHTADATYANPEIRLPSRKGTTMITYEVQLPELGRNDADVRELIGNLEYLDVHGALAGVTEIIRERCRAIAKGWTPERDQQAHASGSLWNLVSHQVAECRYGVAELSEGPEFVEEKMRRAGQYAAAEIDRLYRMLTGTDHA